MYSTRHAVLRSRFVGSPAFRFCTTTAKIDHERKAEACPPRPKSFNEIPGPKGLPFLGTLFEYVKPGGLRFDKLFEVLHKRSQQYGAIYKETIAGKTIVTISDLKEYLKIIKIDGKYPMRPIFDPLWEFREMKKIDHGIVNTNGREWFDRRQLVGPKLLKPQEILKYVEKNDEVASDFVESLRSNFGSRRPSSQDKTLGFVSSDLGSKLFLWSLEASATAICGTRLGCLKMPPPENVNKFINNVHGTFKGFQNLLYGLPLYKYFPTKSWKSFEKHYSELINEGYLMINENLKKIESNSQSVDIISYLLSNTSMDMEATNTICVDILSGSVETTSTTTLWAIYCLARNAEAQDILYREAVSFLSSPADKIDKDIFGSLKYVKACVKETLRMHPVAFVIPRYCASDVEVCGYSLPAGTLCQANLYSMGLDEKNFPDPHSYKPERWLRDGSLDPVASSFSTLPFGHGPRMCIGRRLAEMEMYIMLTKLVRNFKFEWVGERDVEAVLKLLMVPAQPIQLRITPRD